MVINSQGKWLYIFKLTAQLEWYKNIPNINCLAFMHCERFLKSMDEAMQTEGVHVFSSLLVLVEPAATNTEKSNGALSSISFL